MDFENALAKGRVRYVLHKLFHMNTMLPTLDMLTDVVKPEGQTYRGMQDVDLQFVAGTENRSKDFTKGFYPAHAWMRQRWKNVKESFLSGRISEPIVLILYGGYYFVRDGNHRVSIAKISEQEFVSADVTELKIPIKLPMYKGKNLKKLFRAKYRFHKRTK
ncbi:MAG: hypothetical protein ACLFR1_11300, partial [Spirochaetia bacterium]